MIAWLVMLAVAFPVTLVLHEASHALVARSRGATITAFKPWPHFDADGIFRFGEVHWIYGEDWRPTRFLWSAPLAVDAVVGAAGILVGLLLWPPALAFAASSATDALWWVRGYFGWWSSKPYLLDGQKWRNHPGATVLVAGVELRGYMSAEEVDRDFGKGDAFGERIKGMIEFQIESQPRGRDGKA